MIGGATTSRMHTALRIDPEYSHGTFWVKDASRAVGVTRRLTEAEARRELARSTADEFEQLRRRRAGGSNRQAPVDLATARDNHLKADFGQLAPPPRQPGLTVFEDYPLDDLIDYIDWTPFFQSWELTGRFPDILTDPRRGKAAQSLYKDARAMLERIVEERWLRARAVIGLYPAAAEGDDVLLFESEDRERELARFHFLRQQKAKAAGRPHLCLADFVAPRELGLADHLGLFAVTTGIGIEERLAAFEAAHDDYSAILLKALADRLAEALAERLHQRVRREFWAYAADEELDNQSLIDERYQGIRPAPGYPACPEHSEKGTLFRLLDAESNASMNLTEGFAMLPAASVSGFYFAHPQAQYFVLGEVLEDQVEDYARRKGLSPEEVHRLLPHNARGHSVKEAEGVGKKQGDLDNAA
jgi:5-methyltetrahydrofolate--homocysteine methyltransferase